MFVAETPYPNRLLEGVPPGSRRGLCAVAMAGTALVGAAVGAVVSDRYSGDPLHFPKLGVKYVTAGTCETDLTDERSAIQAQIEQLPKGSMSASIEKRADFIFQTAKENGLTIFSPRITIEDLQTATTANEALEIFNGFAGNYGFQAHIHSDSDIKDIGLSITPLNAADIDVDQFKRGLSGLLSQFYSMPKEVITYGRFNELRIVEAVGDKDGQSLTKRGRRVEIEHPDHVEHGDNGMYVNATGVVYLPVRELYSPDGGETFRHEVVGHSSDMQFCGYFGANDDPSFSGLNVTPAKIYNSLQHVRRYSTSSVSEAKADVAATLLPTIMQTAPEQTAIRAQQAEYIARLNHAIPGFGNFVLTISDARKYVEYLVNRPTQTPVQIAFG